MAMIQPALHRPNYSRAEVMSDAVVHVLGLVMVTAGVPVLIVLAALLRGDAASVVGASVYGATLVLMILCSALYNMIQRPDWAWLLQRMDHSAIYLKIAGTYTPFILLTGQGGFLGGLVWIAAGFGVALKVHSPQRFRAIGLALYLGMGWAAVALGGEMIAVLPGDVLALMVSAGILYSVGVAFYLWERLTFHYTIWHIFVLTASLTLYAAVLLLIVIGPQSPL
jgi:hemolysin III